MAKNVKVEKKSKKVKTSRTQSDEETDVTNLVVDPTPKKSKRTKSKEVEAEAEPEVDDNDADEVPKKAKEPVTLESYIGNIDTILELLEEEIDKRSRRKEKGTRTLRTLKRYVKDLKMKAPKLSKRLRQRKLDPTKIHLSGFMLEKTVSKELATFLKIKPTDKISRIEATRAICVYAHLDMSESRPEMLRWKHLNPNGSRDLQDPTNKKVILPDAGLKKLLKYGEYQKEVAAGEVTVKRADKFTKIKQPTVVTDDSLFYYVIQKLVQVHFE